MNSCPTKTPQRRLRPSDLSGIVLLESKERGPVHWLAQRGGVRELLCVPAALFGCVARLRAGLYDRRLLSVQEVGVPVVSIGNITAGGTGKTPMVALVVRTLIAQGYQPAILSRGYGSSPGVPNDEALELARLLPETEHVQEPRRVAGAARLVDRGADVIVMDDGFQHRHLARNLDLVLIDATRPVGLPRPRKGGDAVQAFLPRGLMRENFDALKRADFLVITRADQVPPQELEELELMLAEQAGGIPVALARHRPEQVWTPDGGRPVETLAGLEVDLISAIGNPEAFERTLKDLGAKVCEHRIFEDHHDYSAKDLEGLGERPLLTTMKDGVKLESVGGPQPWIVEVSLEIYRGIEGLGELLSTLPKPTAAARRASLRGGLVG